jgi:hypothetical protein
MAKATRQAKRWNGLPLYECPYCAYNSTVSARQVDEHIAGAHADQIRLDNLVKKEKKVQKEAETPSGDLPAGSAGAAPTASASAKEEKK